MTSTVEQFKDFHCCKILPTSSYQLDVLSTWTVAAVGYVWSKGDLGQLQSFKVFRISVIFFLREIV